MTSSVSNHVTGLENGSDSGWWTHTVPEGSGSGSGSGSSSSSSWSGSWNPSYDQTVTYPGFAEARYYGRDSGGGPGEEDSIAYVGDAFYESPGSDTGFFLFAYSDEELLFGQAQGRCRLLDIRKSGGTDSPSIRTAHLGTEVSSPVDAGRGQSPRQMEAASMSQERQDPASQPFPDEAEGNWTPEEFFGTGFLGFFPSPLIRQTRFGCGGLAAWRAGCDPFDPKGVNQYHPRFIQRPPGTQRYTNWEEAVRALKGLGDEGGLIIAVQYGAGGAPSNYATLLTDKAGTPYWEYANHGWQSSTTGARIIHARWLPEFPKTEFLVVPGRVARFRSPIPEEHYKPFAPRGG